MTFVEIGFYACMGLLGVCLIIGWIWPRREL